MECDGDAGTRGEGLGFSMKQVILRGVVEAGGGSIGNGYFFFIKL